MLNAPLLKLKTNEFLCSLCAPVTYFHDKFVPQAYYKIFACAPFMLILEPGAVTNYMHVL